MITKPLTNELLKGKMTDAMVYRGRAQGDINQILTPGSYLIGADVTGLPTGAYQYGVLEVIAGGDFLLQRYTSHASGAGLLYPSVYERVRFQKAFTPWIKLTTTIIT